MDKQARQTSLEGFAADLAPCVVDEVRKPGRTLHGFNFLIAAMPVYRQAPQLYAASLRLHRHFALPLRRAQAEDRLHCTLLNLERELAADGQPAQLTIDAIGAAMRGLRLPALAPQFDRVMGTHGGALKLLLAEESHERFLALRRLVTSMLRRAGVKVLSNGLPHMSLQYEIAAQIDETPIDPPIDCAMSRLALILSHVGQTHHQVFAEWPLG